MKLSDFGYSIPEELIAQYPLKKRDKARLLVVNRSTKKFEHDIFSNIGLYLPEGSRIVTNNSKVIPARLLGFNEKTGGQREIFLLKILPDGYSYKTLLRPLRRFHNGDRIYFDINKGFFATVIDWKERIVRFNKKNIASDLRKTGHIPLPPYIKRDDELLDRSYYQTVYAKKEGSVASPTAGLHFTKGLIKKLEKEGHVFESVTLHVNYATFKPVEEKDITKHKMHSEEYSVDPRVYSRLVEAKESGRKIVAVGTTSCRVLEAVSIKGVLKGTTDIFIYPGYKFNSTDCLITNFHLPFSTLLMLASAFAGKELIRKAYLEAIRLKYRFFSYGDAMLII
ncbi:MAG: tRNA preQ1(34) S-adenosylmethionine ribosyltransferase-isomerase QueA [Candidatus Omnitrophica bacterium]|nr:tRNA preQ1(34) S-adenosylmethionine ribosyltransferase-isomerase QueA [Candidatus Omnitrophota bacterium]